jgi:heme exporter protein A
MQLLKKPIFQKPTNINPEEVLSFCNLTAQFDSSIIYDNLSLSLLPSSVLAITAPNGTGKTTLLKQIAGLHHIDDGQIIFANQQIKTTQNYERQLVWIGTAHGLIPHLTVMEQLTYIAQMWGDLARLPATIHYFGLAGFLDNKISELSSGWQRRVAFAKLLLIPAKIWVLDEPFNHLDGNGIYLLSGLLNSHAERGGITIFSSTLDNLPKLPNHPIINLELLDFIN